jgi:hypothetical protein
MKKQILPSLLSTIIFAIILSGCGKTQHNPTPPGGSTGKFSFANSEYTGIGNSGNHYYPRPISIRFNDDSTMSTFTDILLNNDYRIVYGKITNVATNTQGGTDITVSYTLPAEQQYNGPQVYTISADKSTLSGGAFPLFALINMKLFPTKTPSIQGLWAAKTGYPDINAISFGADSTATYVRGGKTLTYGGDPTTVIHAKYSQDGGRLKFIGINENYNDLLVQYYGVISAEGKNLYADSYDFPTARLPTIYGGSEAYGTIGVTPSLQRQ